MGERTFAISYGSVLLPVFAVLGLGPRYSRVIVTADEVRVRLGWAFRAGVPRSAVRRVEPDDGAVLAWGAHGWRGRWLVNGSSTGLVRLTVDPPAAATVAGWPVRVRELRLSLEAPGFFMATLRPRDTGASP
jgi:hypothetical protein